MKENDVLNGTVVYGRKKVQVKLSIIALAMAFILSLTMFQTVSAYEKQDYLTLVDREIGLTRACSYYDSLVTKELSVLTLSAMPKSVYYTEGEEYVNTANWDYLRPYYVDVPVYTDVQHCYEVDVYNNLTSKSSTISMCEDVPTATSTKQELRHEWVPYSWDVNAEHLRYCADIDPVTGFRSIEHVPVFGGFEFKEYDYWNSTCTFNQQFAIKNNNLSDSLKEWNPFVFSFDHAGNVSGAVCNYVNGSDFGITYDNGTHNVTVNRINISAWNQVDTNVTFAVQKEILAAANDSNYYWWCGCDLTTPAEDMNKISNAWSNITSYYSMDNLIDTKEGWNLAGQGTVVPDSFVYKFGRSYSFSGASSYLYNQTKWDIVDSSAISAEAWVYELNGGSIQHSLISKKQTQSPYRMFQIDTETGSNCTRFYIDGGTTQTRYCDGIDYASWHHVVAVLNSTGGQTIYYDGELINASNGVWINNGTASDFLIGGYGQQPTANSWLGNIDNVVTYQTELNAEQVSALYRSDIPVRSFTYIEPIPSMVDITSGGAPAPPANVTNVTVQTAVLAYCEDEDVLYQVITVANDTGNLVYNVQRTSCQYGCQNETIWALGAAGCAEAPWVQWLIVLGILIVFSIYVRWVQT